MRRKYQFSFCGFILFQFNYLLLPEPVCDLGAVSVRHRHTENGEFTVPVKSSFLSEPTIV